MSRRGTDLGSIQREKPRMRCVGGRPTQVALFLLASTAEVACASNTSTDPVPVPQCTVLDAADARLTAARFHAELWQMRFLVRGFDERFALRRVTARRARWDAQAVARTISDDLQRWSERCRNCSASAGCQGCPSYQLCSQDPVCIDSGHRPLLHDDRVRSAFDAMLRGSAPTLLSSTGC